MKCTRCERTETARWYTKSTSEPYCCSCYRKEYVAKNREKALASQRKANTSDKSIQARKDYAQTKEGKKSRSKCDKKRYWSDPEKYRARNRTEEQKARLRSHYRRNKAYYTEKSARRSRRLDKASLGGAYKDDTLRVYSTCPKGYHVDHIIPIKGYDFLEGKRQQVVSGLHVPWNLQHLKEEENRTKSCNLYSIQEDQCRYTTD